MTFQIKFESIFPLKKTCRSLAKKLAGSWMLHVHEDADLKVYEFLLTIFPYPSSSISTVA